MGYEPQKDFGTPESLSEITVQLTIDRAHGTTVTAGTSVMRATAESGGQIPKLCATDNVAAYGSSPSCLVEVDEVGHTRQLHDALSTGHGRPDANAAA